MSVCSNSFIAVRAGGFRRAPKAGCRAKRLLSLTLTLIIFSTFLVFLSSTKAEAVPGYVQSATGGNISTASTTTATFGMAATVGNLVVAAYTWDDSAGLTTSCTDNAGNTYAVAASYDDGAHYQASAVCYAIVTNSGTTAINVHYNGASPGYRVLSVSEYSGVSTTNPVDATAWDTGTETGGVTDSVSSSAATTTVSKDLIFGMAMEDTGTSNGGNTAGTNFTLRSSAGVVQPNDLSTEDEIQTSPGPVAATETWQSNDAYTAIMVAFKPASYATDAALTMSDPTPSATGVTDTVNISGVSQTLTKCIKISYLTTLAGGGVKPTGLSVATAALDSSSTYPASPASWTVSDDNTNGVITLTKSAGFTPSSTSGQLVIDSITNASSSGTYYMTVNSYTNASCSSGAVDVFALASSNNAPTQVNVAILPAFTFGVTGQSSTCNGESDFSSNAGGASTVFLGHLMDGANVSGGQALSVTSNASGGFSVYVRGSQASQNLRSGGHNWADVAGSYLSPAPLGSGERFGYTYHDSTSATSVTNPASANFVALTNTNNAVMGSNTSLSGNGCVTFDVQAGLATPSGAYTATITYTAVPNF
jgi:hypothetical protein